MAVSEAQKRATTNWRKKNPEQNRFLRYLTSARTFARHYARRKDIEEIVRIFETENPNAKEG